MPTAATSRRSWCQALAAWLLFGGWMISTAALPSADEYPVKAVFLYNFTKFISWPAEPDASTNSAFVIGIVGEDPFGPILDDAVRDELVQHRPIVVRRFPTQESIGKCHLLFIARSEKDRLGAVLERARNQTVLTVADTPEAAQQGVMINLSFLQGGVKMEINQDAIESAGLQVSAKLLSLARIVTTKTDKPSSKP